MVECIDRDGTTTFAERCPPGMTKKGEKQLRGLGGNEDDEEASAESVAKDHPVTLFTVEKCEACDMVRNHMRARSIPFTEVNVSDNQEHFNQLTEITGGAATVPTLTIDEKVLTGYNSVSLDGALNDAGYPPTNP